MLIIEMNTGRKRYRLGYDKMSRENEKNPLFDQGVKDSLV